MMAVFRDSLLARAFSTIHLNGQRAFDWQRRSIRTILIDRGIYRGTGKLHRLQPLVHNPYDVPCDVLHACTVKFRHVSVHLVDVSIMVLEGTI